MKHNQFFIFKPFGSVRLHIGKPVPCSGHRASFCRGRPACLPKQRANTQVRPYNGFIKYLQDILVHGFLTAQVQPFWFRFIRVRTNKIDVSWGKHYDWLFDNRQKADYRALVQFDSDQVRDIIEQSQAFVEEMKGMLINQ